MKIAVFSTCHKKGFETFGREFITSFFDYMPNDIHFHVFSEDWEIDFEHENFFLHNIEDVEKWKNFKLKYPDQAGVVQKEDGKQIYNYRYNALGFSAKVFPLETLAKMDYDWIISLDCDVKFHKFLPKEVLEGHLPPGATAVYLGRKDYAHSETGFVAYNMNRNAGRMINRMINLYETGEVFKLEGWTDSYVFDHVKDLFESVKTDYYRFYNISKEIEGLHVWPKTWLAEYMDHLKGPAAKAGVSLLNEFPNTLIGQAVHTVSQFKPRTIVDIGVMDGARGVALAKASLWAQTNKPVKNHPPLVHLFALDPFNDKQEEILGRFHKFKEEDPRFSFTYISKTLHPDKWHSEVTVDHPELGQLELGKSDFGYVDGEHTVEALERDLIKMLPYCKMIMSPTYFLPDESGKGPDTNFIGCNSVIEKIPYKLLPAKDTVEEGGVAKAVVFGPSITPGFGKVQTRNAVPDEAIQSQIADAIKYDPNYIKWELKETDLKIESLQKSKDDIAKRRQVPFLNQCSVHSNTALILAGGPSICDKNHPDYQKNWEAINEYRKRDDVRTFVVKTCHDHMIYERGEIPWGCLLLDPRAHVKDFISEPHPDVRYFAASMCHPTTWNVLLDKAKKLYGYNAAVKAGEIGHVHKTIGFRRAVFFGGGSSSATRGIGVCHGLGFRKFALAGWDQCWWDLDKIDMQEKDALGRPRYVEVDMFGRKFVTQPILLAAAQDFESSYKEHPDLDFDILTDGMIMEIWKKLKREKQDFHKLYDD